MRVSPSPIILLAAVGVQAKVCTPKSSSIPSTISTSASISSSVSNATSTSSSFANVTPTSGSPTTLITFTSQSSSAGASLGTCSSVVSLPPFFSSSPYTCVQDFCSAYLGTSTFVVSATITPTTTITSGSIAVSETQVVVVTSTAPVITETATVMEVDTATQILTSEETLTSTIETPYIYNKHKKRVAELTSAAKSVVTQCPGAPFTPGQSDISTLCSCVASQDTITITSTATGPPATRVIVSQVLSTETSTSVFVDQEYTTVQVTQTATTTITDIAVETTYAATTVVCEYPQASPNRPLVQCPPGSTLFYLGVDRCDSKYNGLNLISIIYGSNYLIAVDLNSKSPSLFALVSNDGAGSGNVFAHYDPSSGDFTPIVGGVQENGDPNLYYMFYPSVPDSYGGPYPITGSIFQDNAGRQFLSPTLRGSPNYFQVAENGLPYIENYPPSAALFQVFDACLD